MVILGRTFTLNVKSTETVEVSITFLVKRRDSDRNVYRHIRVVSLNIQLELWVIYERTMVHATTSCTSLYAPFTLYQ
jgi:hypothetical protein